ncbi:hypothetical protein [Bacillus paramycoides]|uniref:hypothetical protein n=1 Tax=Bacillus paramycoides TaxID=2026194 RepID=UPI0037F2F0F5
MTVHYFIAADKELPAVNVGMDEGDKNIEPFFINLYEEEFVEIVTLETYYEPIRKHFNKMFVYEIYGYLSRPGGSVRTLFNYINCNLNDGEEIEIYSCLDGEEAHEKDDVLQITIDLKNLQFGKHIKLNKKKYIEQLGDTFFLEDKQFVVVKK